MQYPDASWQVPADVRCVGDLLSLCAFSGIVDEASSRMSHAEFSRQFLSELDYGRERENLARVHRSWLDPGAPHARRGVVVPRPHEELCTGRVVTMTYLPGPKFEEEARRHLASLGVDAAGGGGGDGGRGHDGSGGAQRRDDEGRRGTTRDDEGTADGAEGGDGFAGSATPSQSRGDRRRPPPSRYSRRRHLVASLVSVDAVLWMSRFARRVVLWSTSIAARCVRVGAGPPRARELEGLGRGERRRGGRLRAAEVGTIRLDAGGGVGSL